MKWRSPPSDWQAAIDEYDRKLASGEFKFDAKGDIIAPERPGWLAFIRSKLPGNNFSWLVILPDH